MPAKGSGFESPNPIRLTPFDIQEKMFRTARLGGGYQVREVDEFLDQITDTLSALIAENERLASGQQAPAATAPPAPRAISGEDRSAVMAFLQRERVFLQSLGTVVQEHADALRQMARAARHGSEPAGPAPTVVEASAATPPDEPEGSAAAIGARPAHVPAGSVESGGMEETASAGPAGEIEAEIDDADASSTTAEHPIRLEEPEPARSKPETEAEGSLRELFWGED